MENELFQILDGNESELSPDGKYRYTLTRQWDDGQCVAFLMFNPSTADATQDDATIRKCIGFAKRWGYGRMVVLNLYAIRSRDPKAVAKDADPVGPLNNYWIQEAAKESREIVCAWGCAQHMPDIRRRVGEVIHLLAQDKSFGIEKLWCLGKRKDGQPRHPLMLAYTTERESFL